MLTGVEEATPSDPPMSPARQRPLRPLSASGPFEQPPAPKQSSLEIREAPQFWLDFSSKEVVSSVATNTLAIVALIGLVSPGPEDSAGVDRDRREDEPECGKKDEWCPSKIEKVFVEKRMEGLKKFGWSLLDKIGDRGPRQSAPIEVAPVRRVGLAVDADHEGPEEKGRAGRAAFATRRVQECGIQGIDKEEFGPPETEPKCEGSIAPEVLHWAMERMSQRVQRASQTLTSNRLRQNEQPAPDASSLVQLNGQRWGKRARQRVEKNELLIQPR